MGWFLPALASAAIGAISANRDKKNAYRAAEWEREQDRQDAATQFVRLRDAARAAGFNPLTALNSGHSMRTTAGAVNVPPLASNNFLQMAMGMVNDGLSGDYAMRQERARAELDLLRLETERLRSGGFQNFVTSGPSTLPPVTAPRALPGRDFGNSVERVGDGPSPFKFGIKVGPTPNFYRDDSVLDEGRPTEYRPSENHPGIMEIEGDDYGPYYVLGVDGEPLGIDELVTVLPQVGPQMVRERVLATETPDQVIPADPFSWGARYIYERLFTPSLAMPSN